jgi:hypothetical protein
MTFQLSQHRMNYLICGASWLIEMKNVFTSHHNKDKERDIAGEEIATLFQMYKEKTFESSLIFYFMFFCLL